MGLILEGGAHVVEDLPALQDVRLQDVPLNNRRPDVTVYRADTIDVTPTRPERVPLVHTYVLDPAAGRHRDGDVFTGIVKLTAPFSIEIDPSRL
jgi:hypothetical protein